MGFLFSRIQLLFVIYKKILNCCLVSFLNCKGKGKKIYLRKKDFFFYSVVYVYHFIVSTQLSPLPLHPFSIPALPTALHANSAPTLAKAFSPFFSGFSVPRAPRSLPCLPTLTSLHYLFFSKKGLSCHGNSHLLCSTSPLINNCLHLIDDVYMFSPTQSFCQNLAT